MGRNFLSEGIYDPPTAARLLLAGRMARETYPVTSRTLIRWIREGFSDPELIGVHGHDLLLSFEDLISLRVIAALRAARVPWSAIRRADRFLRDATGHARPFAREELWTTSSEICVRFKDVLISASRHGQAALEIMTEYLYPVSGLVFANEVAVQWKPARGIVIDPTVQFGEPCIEGTRIPVRAIVSLVESGDPPGLVQRSYRLTDSAMRDALAWGDLAAAA